MCQKTVMSKRKKLSWAASGLFGTYLEPESTASSSTGPMCNQLKPNQRQVAVTGVGPLSVQQQLNKVDPKCCYVLALNTPGSLS